MEDSVFSCSGKQNPPSLTQCKVCSRQAQYCYFNAIVCHSCKMFFKRNAEHRRSLLKCNFNNNCEINADTRPMCAACRLQKCFHVGMCSGMIRGSYGKNMKSTGLTLLRKEKQITRIPRLIEPEVILKLNSIQWRLLTNLIQCFDKYVENSTIQQFVNEQNNLPVKVRFKFPATKDFFTSTKAQIQLVSEQNPHILSLSSNDRQILLRKTIKHVTSLGGMFILRKYNLLDYVSFRTSAEMIFRPNAAAFARCVVDQLDPDETLIKLILAIITFSTINCTTYEQSDWSNFSNLKSILFIQDIYTEITWRYLVYRCGHEESVRRFSNITRCLFLMNSAVAEAEKSQPFTDMIDSLVKQTEKTTVST